MKYQRLMYGKKFTANNIDGYLVRVARETQGGRVLYHHVSRERAAANGRIAGSLVGGIHKASVRN